MFFFSAALPRRIYANVPQMVAIIVKSQSRNYEQRHFLERNVFSGSFALAGGAICFYHNANLGNSCEHIHLGDIYQLSREAGCSDVRQHMYGYLGLDSIEIY